MRWIMLAVVAAAVGCADRGGSNPWDLNNEPTNAASNNATTNNGTVNDTTSSNGATCDGGPFDCVMSCATDFFASAECVGGGWQCPQGDWFPIENCPSGSCFGLPLPGEECVDGFQCLPDSDDLERCHAEMCATCRGFDPALHSTPQCRCECVEDEQVVRCARPDDCATTSFSTLDGVEIRLEGDRCSWTIEELEAGVSIGWDVVVDDTAPATVMPAPQDAGRCGRPGPSGLITFHQVTGADGDRYCRCDEGLCAPDSETSMLVEGTHTDELEWTGHNWSGPSDTGLPMGAAFQPGTATVRVSAVGTTLNDEEFEVYAEMEIEVLP